MLEWELTIRAEYKALIRALESASELGSEAVCYSDSELVVNQMNGDWRVKHSNMIPLWKEAVAIKAGYQKISFVYAPRTNKYVKRIDQLANRELDKHIDGLTLC